MSGTLDEMTWTDPAVKFRTKTPMNSQQLSLESCNSWKTVQPVLAWTIHRWRLDAKCLVVVVVCKKPLQNVLVQCNQALVHISIIFVNQNIIYENTIAKLYFNNNLIIKQ